jgi:hypothetical protein
MVAPAVLSVVRFASHLKTVGFVLLLYDSFSKLSNPFLYSKYSFLYLKLSSPLYLLPYVKDLKIIIYRY